MTTKQLVVFCILMENHKGIIGKSPSYIQEKIKSVDSSYPEGLLDKNNLIKYHEYISLWRLDVKEEVK